MSAPDPQLVEWIHEDRRDQGWSQARATDLSERYLAWLERLGRPVSDEQELLAADWLDSTFFRPGRAATVYAPMGRGKTHMAAWLIQQAARFRPGWDLYTNVPFAWDYVEGCPRPPSVHRVRSMSELLRGIAGSMLANRRSAPIIDEFDQADNSHQWQSEASRSWTKFVFIERHLRVRGPLLVHHDFDWIPRPLRKGDLGKLFRMFRVSGEFRCVDREDLGTWRVVPDCALPFGTLALTGFAIDLDVAELEAGLSGGHLDVARQIIAYLDELEAARQEEAEAGALEARAAHRTSVAATQQALAESKAAWLRRREEIIAALRSGRSRNAVCAQFGTSPHYVAELEAVARSRPMPEGHVPPLEVAP